MLPEELEEAEAREEAREAMVRRAVRAAEVRGGKEAVEALAVALAEEAVERATVAAEVAVARARREVWAAEVGAAGREDSEEGWVDLAAEEEACTEAFVVVGREAERTGRWARWVGRVSPEGWAGCWVEAEAAAGRVRAESEEAGRGRAVAGAGPAEEKLAERLEMVCLVD